MNEPVSCRLASKAGLAEIPRLHVQPDFDSKALPLAEAGLSSNPRRERTHTLYESPDFERHGYSYRMLLDPPPQDF